MAGKTLPFRLYAQILIFSALVTLGMLILLPLQKAVQGGMVSIRDDLIIRLEDRIDRKIQYTSISPSLLGSFDVRGVCIMGEDEQPMLTMSRFRVAYSLLDLLRGRVQAIHAVQIDMPFIDFNTARDQDLIDLFKKISAGNDGSRGNAASVFPEKLILRIRGGRCLILNGGNQFEIDALNVNAEIAHNMIILDGDWNTGITINRLIGSPVSLYAAMKASGSCQTDVQEGEAVFSIPSISGDASSACPIAFGLVLEKGLVRIGKMPDQLPFDFFFEYGIDNETIVTQFDCANFRLREFISFSGGLENARQFLDIAGSGTAVFERTHDGSLSYAVDMSGAAFAPLVTGAPASGYLPFQAAGASFQINAAGDENRADIKTFRFSMPAAAETGAVFFGSISFSGGVGLAPFAPDGTLVLDNFSLSGTENVNAHIAVNTHNDDGEITVFCPVLNLGTVDLAAFRAVLKPAGDELGFTVSALRSAGVNYGNESARALSMQAVFNTESQYMESDLKLSAFSAGDIAGMMLPFVKNASLLVPLKGLLIGAELNTEVMFAVSGKDRRFELRESRFKWGADILSLSGQAEYIGAKDVHFAMSAAYRDLAYLVEGTVLDGKSINIHGSHGLDVNLSAGGKGYTGALHIDGFPVPFMGQQASIFCTAQLNYENTASWRMNLERFELAGITTPAGLARLQVSGGADQNGAAFPQLHYRDNLGPLDGNAEISWSKDYSYFTVMVDIRDSVEIYHANASYADSRFKFSLVGSSVRLERIFGGKISALANGDIHLFWDSIGSFGAEFNLSSVNGRIYDRNFMANARAVLDNEKLTVNSLRFRLADIEGTVPHFIISSSQGMAETRFETKGFIGEKPLKGEMLLTANFMPMQSWFEINKMLNSVAGTVHVEGLKYGNEDEVQAFDIAFSRSGGAVAVSGGPRDMLRFRMDQDGNFYAGLSNPFPVRGTVVGSVKHNIIDARCGDLYVDAGELFKLLPGSDEFYLTGGYVSAAVDIKGSVRAPEFFGTARGTSLRIMIPKFMTYELRPIPVNIAIEGNEMRFGPVPVASGSGAATVSGQFIFDRWIPNIFNFDITIPRETPVPYGFDITGFTAHGDASGKLNVSMENQTFDISGDLYVNNTELGINSEEITSLRGADPFSQAKIPFVLDIIVSTGPVVEFLYPSTRVPILRANPDMGTKLHVTADSLVQQYSLNSDVKIRGGEIFYFERNFYIRSGMLRFRENELNFAPLLSARAEIRDRTENGPVTVSMIVDNAPLFEFTARFEATPSLSQMEIFTLLGQNITGIQVSENPDAAQRALISSTSDIFAQFVVVRQLEQQIRGFMRLDMFSVRTQVIQNAFFMATGIMQPPVDRLGGVGNYFDNTTVFGGKYIGQDMFVQGMLTMRYDANNTSTGGLTFAPDIGIELQNPLFSIRWDFVPTHPENWYVNDNSITLIKSWSF